MLITFGVFGLKCNWLGKVGRQHVLWRRYKDGVNNINGRIIYINEGG